MDSQLFSRYSYDECKDEKKLFEKLKQLSKQGKLEFSKEDQYLFKVKDIELGEKEIDDLNDFFDKLDVFPYLEEIDELESYDYNDDYQEDEDDEYISKRYRSKEDDYDDF